MATNFSLAGVALLGVALCMYKDYGRIRQLRSFNNRGAHRQLRATSVRTAMTTWAMRVLPRADRYLGRPFARHFDRCALLFALVVFMCSVAGIIAGAFYTLPIIPPTANHHAVITLFDDALCADSPERPAPTGYIAIEADGECHRAQARISTNVSTMLFLSATCNGASAGAAGTVQVQAALGPTCRLAPAETLRTGGCTALTNDQRFGQFLGSRASQYFRVDCLMDAAVRDLTIAVSGPGLTGTAQRSRYRPSEAQVAASLVAARRRNVTFVAAYEDHPFVARQDGTGRAADGTGSAYYAFTALRPWDGTVHRFSSAFSWRLMSQSVLAPAFFGKGAFDFPAAAIVSQQSATFDLDSRRGDRFDWRDEVAVHDDQRSLPRSSNRDLAVGYFFNDVERNLSNTRPLQSRAAGRDVLVFPNVAGTGIDMGLFEQPAVSFFIRATPESKGFVFALGDDVRISNPRREPLADGSTSGIAHLPLLDRLYGAVENGNNASWFRDAGLDVTMAVYADGTRNMLSVVSFDGSRDLEPIVALFRLDEVGIGRVFTNTWHHISFRFLDGLVELTVDGQTNRLVHGWSSCAERRIAALQRRTSSAGVSLPSPVPEHDVILYPGGALYVGAINAGIHGLQFYQSAPQKYDLSVHATHEMLRFLQFNSQAYTYLAFYLVFVAVVLMTAMLTGVISEYLDEKEKAQLADFERARENYYDIFDIDDTINVVSVGGEEYTALRLESAVGVTQLDMQTFALVLEEIQKLAFSAEDARADLLAFLWTQGKKGFVPPERLWDTFEQWRDVESGELSENAQFALPVELWEQLVRQYDGEVVKRRAIRIAGQGRSVEGDGGGNMQQLRGLKALKGAKSGGGKGGGSAASGQSSSASTLVQMLLPVTLALQTISVYADNWSFPTDYLDWIGDVLDIFSFDFLTLFKSLDTVEAAAIIFGIAMLFFLLLTYYAIADHRLFTSIAARYVLKRDAADREEIHELVLRTKKASSIAATANETGDMKERARRKSTAFKTALDISVNAEKAAPQPPRLVSSSSFFSDTSGPLSPTSAAGRDTSENDGDAVEEWMLPLFRYVVPSRISVAIDQHVDGARSSNVVDLEKADLLPAEIGVDSLKWQFESASGDSTEIDVGVVGDSENRRVRLQHVGVKCPLHTNRWLHLSIQTSVTEDPAGCFVVQSGHRCPTSMDKMYVCGYRNKDGTTCPYALCSDHAKMTLGEFLIIVIVTGWRTLKQMGVHGLLAFAVVSAVTIFYFPVINIAMQFLTCDARFQCAFPTCWDSPDDRFYLALVVVLIVLVCIGIGIPAIQMVTLWTRRRVLYRFFYHPQYHRFYLAIDQDTINYGRALLKQQEEDNEIDDDEEDAVFRIVRHMVPTSTASLARATMNAVKAGIPRLSQVSFDEWERFLSIDESNMYPLYYMLEFEWMFLPPIVLLQKVALLAPAVLMEDESLSQFVVVAVVEAVFGVFIFWSQPYLNPWVDTIYRAGSVHNIGLLGLVAYSRVLAASGEPDRLNWFMIAWTGFYLCFVLVLLIATVLVPIVGIVVQQIDVSTQMSRVGMRTIDLSSLFLNPLLHDSPVLTEEEAEAAAAVHDVSSESDYDEERQHADQAEAAKELASKSEAERQLARAEAIKQKRRQAEINEKKRLKAVEQTRVMALEDV